MKVSRDDTDSGGRDVEVALRKLIREIARDEITRALSEHDAPAEYLSTSDAAALAGVATGTIRRWMREGRLARHGSGRLVRVRRVDVERILKCPPRGPDATPEELAIRDFGGRT